MYDYNYYYDFFETLEIILTVYAVIGIFTLIVGIVAYVFQSIGLQKMAKSLNIDNSWMAWVPILSTFLFGTIGSKYVKKDGKPSAKFGGWLLGLDIAAVVFFIAMVASIISMIVNAIIMIEQNPDAITTAFVSSIVSFFTIYFIFLGIAIAYAVVYYIALWRVYSIFDSSTATVFLIVSILFSIATPFILFAIRNHIPCVTLEERMGIVPEMVAAPQAEIPETVNE